MFVLGLCHIDFHRQWWIFNSEDNICRYLTQLHEVFCFHCVE